MTESENDPRDQWLALADAKAEALGISTTEVREAVKRELILRAATEVANEVTTQPSRMRPVNYG